jgi:prefoldin subunit 5
VVGDDDRIQRIERQLDQLRAEIKALREELGA